MRNSFGIPRRTGLRRRTPLKQHRRFRAKAHARPVEKECDILWSAVIRLASYHQCAFRDIECDGRLEAHHIITRSSSFQWDLNNGICMCRYHHQEWHANPEAWDLLVQVIYPVTWQWWQDHRYIIRPQWRPDVEAIRDELSAWRDLLQEYAV